MSEPDASGPEAGRIDAAVERATALTERTLDLFPVRVWRNFLQNNGFLLAAGVSYQALFAIFAAIYLALAIAGLWLGGSTAAVDAVIRMINGYIPNLISDHGGVVTPEQARNIAKSTTSLLSITGLIALGAVIWTAIGWVTYSRRAVRDIFGLPPDRRNFFILKARDLFAALLFGVSLIVGSVLSAISAAALKWLLSLLGWDYGSDTLNLLIRVGTIVASFVVLTAAIAAMVRFLAGTSLHWRTIWPGALLGGAAMTVIQFGAGFLLGYTPSNPLLATFAIFIGLLLWFRISGIVMLVAAAWIAVTAQDENEPLLAQTEAERLTSEHAALLTAARIRLREARDAQRHAPWYRAWSAGRAVRAARTEVEHLVDNPPALPPPEASPTQGLLAKLTRTQGDGERNVTGPR